MNIVFISDWQAKKSIRDFAQVERLLRQFDLQLRQITYLEPEKISLIIEQTLISYFLINQIKTSCFVLLSSEDQSDLIKIFSIVELSAQDLMKKYPDAFSLIASELADNTEKKTLVENLQLLEYNEDNNIDIS